MIWNTNLDFNLVQKEFFLTIIFLISSVVVEIVWISNNGSTNCLFFVIYNKLSSGVYTSTFQFFVIIDIHVWYLYNLLDPITN